MLVRRCCSQPVTTPPAGALGFTAVSQTADYMKWLWIAAALAAAYLLYRSLFGSAATERRARLKAARARYLGQVARIKAGA